MRLAIAASHPIQYYAPLFRELAGKLDIHVFFAHRATPEQQAAAGFGQAFDWDIDLTSGYQHSFLTNLSKRPGTDHFGGCDTPEISRLLSAGRFDALLTFGWYLKSNIQAIVAAKRLGLPVLVRGDSHLDTPRSGLKRAAKSWLYPRLLRVFDAALYVGERSRAYYQHYGFPEERLFFSPHCVDNAWFSSRATVEARERLRISHGIGLDEQVVLFAGKLLAFKRPLDVVEACAKVQSQGLKPRMMVAGSGPMEAEIRQKAEVLGVPLTMLGFKNQSEMPAAYAAADLMMMPSDGETWGLVCNEALACGIPVLVSSEVGCGDDLASDEVAGAIFPVRDTDEAATKLAQLLVQPRSALAIAKRSAEYGLVTAANGIIEALSAIGASQKKLADRTSLETGPERRGGRFTR